MDDFNKRRFTVVAKLANLPDPTGPNLQEGDEIYVNGDGATGSLWKLLKPSLSGVRAWHKIGIT